MPIYCWWQGNNGIGPAGLDRADCVYTAANVVRRVAGNGFIKLDKDRLK